MNEAVPDPLWLDEHRYLTVWKGEVMEVDIRRLRPTTVSDEFIRENSVSFREAVKRWMRIDAE